ncbi:MAG: DUF4232 domain-containing protein [Micromonosporaceae bacterium]|nr:DUF4232 domain-containing protein [Micromonosporaceae bacterium]
MTRSRLPAALLALTVAVLVVAVLMVAVLMVAGCSGGTRPPAQPALIPWDGTVPAALRASSAPPVPPCTASRLAVLDGGFRLEPAATGGGTGTLRLRNAGPSPCRLTGRPGVRIVGAVPAPAQREDALPAQPPQFPTVAPPESALLALAPGATATLELEWSNWCVPPGAGARVPPRAIRLTLPANGGTLDAGYNAVPPCQAPAQPSTVGVRPFAPAPLPATVPWSTVVLRASIEPAAGTGPLTGKPGQSVRFAVRLANPSATPVRFDHCPLLVELLAPAGAIEAHPLNCAAAGLLPAHGALRFEMRIRVPDGAPAGANGLFWELDPTGSQGPQATSRILVTR